MKRKVGIIAIVVLFLSGCMNMSQAKPVEYMKTHNGSVILSKDAEVKKLCTKSALDTFTQNNKVDAIKDEFGISNYDNLLYAKNKNKFSKANVAALECQYQIYYSDFARDSDWIELSQMQLEKDQTMSIEELIKDKKVEEFIQSKPNTIIGQTTQQILNAGNEESYMQKELTVDKAGKYRLVAKPVYRIYHFADTKLIYDFDFSVVKGLSFELQLVK